MKTGQLRGASRRPRSGGWLRAGVTAGMVLIAVALAGRPSIGPAGAGAAEKKLNAVATTGMIADAVQNVGQEHVEVISLMGPGVDPHLYKASQGDLRKLSQADAIFYNGLGLEGKMADLFVRMARQTPTIPVTESVPESELREPPEFQGHYDPHIWFDVRLWIKAVERVRDALVEIDPAHAAAYRQNAAEYAGTLQKLDAEVRARIQTIPKNQRVLVTAHDAFGYFGRAYGIEVVSLQGINTAAEFGLRDVQRLVDILLERNVKAVFIESSVPRRSIDAVVEGAQARGRKVSIGGQLFSDALGAEGTPEGTYAGMVRHNVETIVAALR